ncbi:hypothetical protein TNCT_67361 [Trichonephila clavata]|uniref:Uncharacterized protein n=1 Tax=Trichonephila clavata TaxID=2740835 RepID=A0A8X6JBB5_TRICU|nr:hypothetical protein TNCT_67361 [Trichonephila clavata]
MKMMNEDGLAYRTHSSSATTRTAPNAHNNARQHHGQQQPTAAHQPTTTTQNNKATQNSRLPKTNTSKSKTKLLAITPTCPYQNKIPQLPKQNKITKSTHQMTQTTLYYNHSKTHGHLNVTPRKHHPTTPFDTSTCVQPKPAYRFLQPLKTHQNATNISPHTAHANKPQPKLPHHHPAHKSPTELKHRAEYL